jgi:hypothetical protein
VTLTELYNLFDELRPHRRRAASAILDNNLDLETHEACRQQPGCRTTLDALEQAQNILDSLPGHDNTRELQIDGRSVALNLEYERTELGRDVICLREGMRGVVRTLKVPGAFEEELDAVLEVVQDRHYRAVFSDRDGTIANYCGRYRSSHQPLYAAVRLGRFAMHGTSDFFIVTSGPLYGNGLLSLSAFPEGTVHLAGSKGREFVRSDGTAGSLPLTDAERASINLLDEHLQKLLARPEYAILRSIGSGYQQKLGQLTISTQDIHRSVPGTVSTQFQEELCGVLRRLDPDQSRFEMDQTGFDVELTLTSHADRSRGYHKGDGVKFLVDSFGLDLADGPVLVCGDTPSDLPMLESLVAMGVPTHAIFVAADAELEERVRRLTPHCAFCTGPDVLVTALGIAGQALAPGRRVHRPPAAEDHDE